MRAQPLTRDQKEIIRHHRNLFAADIMKLPGMENTTKRQIQMYQRNPGPSEEQILAEAIETYVEKHGLASGYESVLAYAGYLKSIA